MTTPSVRRCFGILFFVSCSAMVSLAHGATHAGRAHPPAPPPSPTIAPVPQATEVTVERIRPKKEKYATLRFFKENRDFLRSRFDRLKEKPGERREVAESIDPRFLAYQRLLAEARSAQDSLAAAEEARRRRELFASVTDLGELESQLDLMDRLLAEQRSRLGLLQEDFAGRQQTALSIVVSGDAGATPVTALTIKLEDGVTVSVPLAPQQREALRHGGVLQIFHGLVEPREQVIEVSLVGDVGVSSAPGFITLEPRRDHLTFLRLDLSPVRAAEGASSMTASTWTLDSGLHASNGSEPGP